MCSMGCVLAYSSKKLKFVPRSTAEAEFVQMSLLARYLLYLRNLYLEFPIVRRGVYVVSAEVMATFSLKIKKTISKKYMDDCKEDEAKSGMPPWIVNEDNMGAIQMVYKTDIVNGRTSHIRRDQNFIKFAVGNGDLEVTHCAGEHMFADPFTKALSRDLFWKFNSRLVRSREAVKVSSYKLYWSSRARGF